MENVSRFSNSFKGKLVVSGSKMSGSAFPTLTATSTKDKFNLNQKALALMGLAPGSNVVMIDMNKGEVVETDCNKRWYLTAGYDNGRGDKTGAKISNTGGFSYAGIYGAMVLNQPDISEASVKDLVDAGKGIFRETPKEKQAFIGLQKVNFKVEKLVDEAGNDIFEVAEGVYQKVFALTERTEEEHDPKAPAGADDEDTE
jgi:hypothetical protein